MFAVLKVLEPEKGIIPKINYYLRKPLPVMKRINVSMGEPFYYLEIYKQQCGENFEEVCRLLGPAADNVILSEESKLIQSNLIKPYNPVKYRQLLLINSALDYLEHRKSDKSNRCICFVDPNGEYPCFAEKLILNCASLSVLTNYPNKYSKACKSIYESWGASVLLIDKLKEKKAYDMIISPCFSHNILLSNSLLVYNSKQKYYEAYEGSKIVLPPKIKALLPCNLLHLDFAAALYEKCSVRELENICFCDFGIVRKC